MREFWDRLCTAAGGMNRKVRWFIGLSALTVVVAIALLRPDVTARTAAGVAAHSLCSATFVSGADADATFDELVKPLVGNVIASFIGYRVDQDRQSVTATFAGLWQATARKTPAYGCRIDYPGNHALVAANDGPSVIADAVQPDDFAPPEVVRTRDPALLAAIDRVFAEVSGTTTKRVIAVVVVKDGRVIAERYAPGVNVDTPVLSFSVAKSVINALLGILVRQGRIRVSDPVSPHEWSAAGDPRARITFEDLMRMRSGLDAPETGSGFDAATRMLYAHADMAAFAAGARLKRSPGSAWEYTSANTMLLSRALGAKVGGGAAGIRAFAESELFAPVGMRNVTMEFDGAGTFIGSSYVYAPARAFARFGWLYANDGVTREGRRILPAGWIEWSHRSTFGSPYGAGFWTNDGPSEHAAGRVAEGFAKDGFFASGNMGQRVYIVPSQRLVVARFGYSDPPLFGLNEDLALIRVASSMSERKKP